MGYGVDRGPSSIQHGRGQQSSPQILDFEKAYFCRLLSTKLKIHKHQMHGGLVVDSGRVIRSKSFIAALSIHQYAVS